MYGRVLFVTAALLMVSTTGLAQSHPCDVQAPTVFREPSSQLPNLRLAWCYKPEDEDGIPISEPIGFALQINGGPPIDLGVVQPLLGPNTQGYYYYEAQTPRLTAGVLTLKAYTPMLGDSAASAAITLTLRGRPKAPVNTSITDK